MAIFACPACASSSLVAFEAQDKMHVELCPCCKGMLVDTWALQQLTRRPDDVAALREMPGEPPKLGPCPHCSGSSWLGQATPDTQSTGLWCCGSCRMFWLEAGQLARLERQWARKHAAHPLGDMVLVEATTAAGAVPDTVTHERAVTLGEVSTPERPFGRFSFDRGLANPIGVPLSLSLSLLFCSSSEGRFLASLVGMPFHELGHAVASWLGSRFAVPLPFFTIWLNDQSLLFGLALASLIAWFGYHSWREKSHFGLSLSLALLLLQLIVSWLLPTRLTLMFQILGGALGEIWLSALVLAAFHFPLPDRLRWDFWRWPALVPSALCFAQTLWLWSHAVSDTSQMPWGSAIGSASDGDMNRLVRDFGWSANELAAFYLKAVWLGMLAIVGTYGVALHRFRRARSPRSRGTLASPRRLG